jgi:hypothetical protein
MDHSQRKIVWDKLQQQSHFFKTVKASIAYSSLHRQNNSLWFIEQNQSTPENIHGN